MLMLLGLILFILLVVVHEFGHFIAARRSGVEVKEFGLGFPPRAKVLTEKKGTQYTLNWLPLGGFVKLKGEHDGATEKGSFGATSFYRKSLILLAGVFMNWLAAAAIFTLVALLGMPQVLPNQFKIPSDAHIAKQEVLAARVVENSPAAGIGLAEGDKIKSINGTPVNNAEELLALTKRFAGQPVSVAYAHEKREVIKQTTLRRDSKQGNFGVSPAESTLVRSTWSAPLVGAGTTVQFTVETFKGLAGAVSSLLRGQSSQASQSVTGPVGIVITLRDLAKQGLVFVLFLMGIISLSLAVMNSLPIPALDGGRLFVMALFRFLKKPLTKEVEERIHGTGMLLLLILAGVITVVDIKRFF